jgi:hypothetical protein
MSYSGIPSRKDTGDGSPDRFPYQLLATKAVKTDALPFSILFKARLIPLLRITTMLECASTKTLPASGEEYGTTKRDFLSLDGHA